MPGSFINVGTPCQCSFGVAPIPLAGASTVISGGPPGLNISAMPSGTFGMCSNPANPTVAAATAAAAGVLTPMPCTPVYAGTWMPGSATVTAGKLPALTKTCTRLCGYGGTISIVGPGNVKATLK